MAGKEYVRHERHGMREDHTHPYAENEAAETSLLLYKISWGAVFAGVVMALTIHILLNMLGIGITLPQSIRALPEMVRHQPLLSSGAQQYGGSSQLLSHLLQVVLLLPAYRENLQILQAAGMASPVGG